MASNESWDAALAAVHQAGEAAVKAMADTSRERTEARVPVDAGDLKDSFVVEVDGLTGRMGTDSPYAVYVHEDLKDKHDDGQAKFMEAAVTGADSTQAIGKAAVTAAESSFG